MMSESDYLWLPLWACLFSVELLAVWLTLHVFAEEIVAACGRFIRRVEDR